MEKCVLCLPRWSLRQKNNFDELKISQVKDGVTGYMYYSSIKVYGTLFQKKLETGFFFFASNNLERGKYIGEWLFVCRVVWVINFPCIINRHHLSTT